MSFVRAHRVALALALLAVIVVGPIVSPDSAQPASRLTLSAALFEHHSVDLGPYKHALNVDSATYQGHLRSDKAPGQPLLAVPVYALAKLVGAPSASHLRVNSNLELWWVTFWSATVPFACLLALLYLVCSQFARSYVALAVTLLLAFGSMLLPFAANLFGHDLAALLGFGAWIVVERTPLDPRRAALAGLLAGAAVLVEYETFVIAAVLVGYLLFRDRRRIVPFVCGAIAPLLVLGWYQWRAFGAPWRSPAAYYTNPVDLPGIKDGYAIPTWHELVSIVAGPRGLWLGGPIVLVGIGSAIWLAFTADGRVQRHAVVGLAVIVPYLVLCAGLPGTPLLVDPGPRYLIPALAFVAVPLAATWDRVRVVGVPASIIGVLVAGTAAWAELLVSRQTSLLSADKYLLRHHSFSPTLWSIEFGPIGVVVYVVTIAAAVALLVQATRHRTDVRSPVTEPLR